jgi:hypothetical protein
MSPFGKSVSGPVVADSCPVRSPPASASTAGWRLVCTARFSSSMRWMDCRNLVTSVRMVTTATPTSTSRAITPISSTVVAADLLAALVCPSARSV